MTWKEITKENKSWGLCKNKFFFDESRRNDYFNPLTAQRCRSETEIFILEDLFSSVFVTIYKISPSGNLKFNNLGIFQS